MKPGTKPSTRTEQIHVRVTREEREALEAAANRDRRTLSESLVIAGLEMAKNDHQALLKGNMNTKQFIKQMAQYKINVKGLRLSTKIIRDDLGQAVYTARVWKCRAIHFGKEVQLGQAVAFQLKEDKPENDFMYGMAQAAMVKYFMGLPKKWPKP